MLITILIFIVILGILVFVHEFGHFIVAKKSGMVVEEFGFGFPPRLVGLQKKEGKWRVVWRRGSQSQTPTTPQASSGNTVYSINLIPLGGFVRILGENNEHEGHSGSFINKGFWPRFLTLVAGVTMNWILAAVIFSIILGVGTLSEIAPNMPEGTKITNRQVAINQVLPNSPAAGAGLKAGDFISGIDGKKFENIEDARNYIYANKGKTFEFEIQRINEIKSISVNSLGNPKEGEGPTGIDLSDIGRVQLPWPAAIRMGFSQAYYMTGMILSQLGGLFSGGQALEQIGGPVKIAQIVGQVRELGVVPLLNLTALLSLSLAVLNIMPFPALDGGRVLFLLIEKIRGKRNNQKLEQIFNTAGFLLLLGLMLLVTIKDVRGL